MRLPNLTRTTIEPVSAWKMMTAHIKAKGGAVPTKPPSERHASIEELSRALTTLTPAELLRLFARARLLVWGTEYTSPQELFNEAVKRSLVAASEAKQDGERGRPWPIERVPIAAFLSGCMDSCRIPDDCIDSKRYPLFMARAVLKELIESLQSTQGVKPC